MGQKLCYTAGRKALRLAPTHPTLAKFDKPIMLVLGLGLKFNPTHTHTDDGQRLMDGLYLYTPDLDAL